MIGTHRNMPTTPQIVPHTISETITTRGERLSERPITAGSTTLAITTCERGLHLVVEVDRLLRPGIGDALVDGGAQDLRAGGGGDRGGLWRVGRDAVEVGELLCGAGLGGGEAGDLGVVVVFQRGGALDQALAVAERLAVEHLALGLDVAADAVERVVEMGVEARR
jgi:hypothetical protein